MREQRHELRADCRQEVYTFNGHEADLDKLGGQRATVKGSVTGETVMVESLAAAKKVAQ